MMTYCEGGKIIQNKEVSLEHLRQRNDDDRTDLEREFVVFVNTEVLRGDRDVNQVLEILADKASLGRNPLVQRNEPPFIALLLELVEGEQGLQHLGHHHKVAAGQHGHLLATS